MFFSDLLSTAATAHRMKTGVRITAAGINHIATTKIGPILHLLLIHYTLAIVLVFFRFIFGFHNKTLPMEKAGKKGLL